MSEVSVESAFRVYRDDAELDSLEALLKSMVKDIAEHGYTINKIFAFRDVNNKIQLYRCVNTNDELALHNSPHCRDISLIYYNNTVKDIPIFLKNEYERMLAPYLIDSRGTVRDLKSTKFEELLLFLKHKNQGVCVDAIKKIEKSKDSRFIPALCDLLKEGGHRAQCAAYALGKIGDEQAVAPLIQILESILSSHDDFQDYLADAVAGSLSKIGDSRAVSCLVAFISHSKTMNKNSVDKYFFAKYKDQALQKLTRALTNHEYVEKYHIVNHLENLDWKPSISNEDQYFEFWAEKLRYSSNNLSEFSKNRSFYRRIRYELSKDASMKRKEYLERALENLEHLPPRLRSQQFEGKTVEEAQAKATNIGLPLERTYFTEVTHNVRDETAEGEGKTANAAIEAAKACVPPKAFDIRPAEIVQEEEKGVVEIRAQTETEARGQWKTEAPPDVVLEAFPCVAAPKNGFLGIGKKQGIWEAHWSKPFKACIRYKLPAQLTVIY